MRIDGQLFLSMYEMQQCSIAAFFFVYKNDAINAIELALRYFIFYDYKGNDNKNRLGYSGQGKWL